MKNVSIFKECKELSFEDYFTISKEMKFEHFSKDEIIFYHSAKADKFYIILNGSVSVIIPVIENNILNYNEVAILEKGKTFGELALITNKPRYI